MEQVVRKMDAASAMGQAEKVDETDPMEYVCQTRDNTGNKLRSVGMNGCAAKCGSKQSVRGIQATLARNAEIIDQCMGLMMVDSEQYDVSTLIRYKFGVVNIRQPKTRLSLSPSVIV